MVDSSSSFSRDGIRDWLIQRVTSVVIFVYFLVMVSFFIRHPQFTYNDWTDFNGLLLIRILTLMTIISVLAHAWIGLWTVVTDYIKNVLLRVMMQIVIALLLLFYTFWGLLIVLST